MVPPARDPVLELLHDHEDLNELVRSVGDTVRAANDPDAAALAAQLVELREQMFLHFAREEEGAFPFIAAVLPEVADEVTTMLHAHDAVCGAVARMIHAVRAGQVEQTRTLFDRFELAYTLHARAERIFLQGLVGRLAPEDARQLAELVSTV